MALCKPQSRLSVSDAVPHLMRQLFQILYWQTVCCFTKKLPRTKIIDDMNSKYKVRGFEFQVSFYSVKILWNNAGSAEFVVDWRPTCDMYWELSELSLDLQEYDVDLNRASTQTEKHCFNIYRMKGMSWPRFQASSVVQLSPLLFWNVTWHRLVVSYQHCPDLSVTGYQSTLGNIPEQQRTQCHGHYKSGSWLQNFSLSKKMPSTKTGTFFDKFYCIWWIHIRNTYCLQRLNVNSSHFQDSPYYAAMKIFSNLSYNIWALWMKWCNLKLHYTNTYNQTPYTQLMST